MYVLHSIDYDLCDCGEILAIHMSLNYAHR